MATIACLLHHHFEYFFWTGFYRVAAPGELLIGPYQGTLGCLHIRFDQGVCGAAARKGQTIIVPDVHQFPGHIACDPNSRSEIVVPVFNDANELIAVLDVDSDEYSAFDEVDKKHLEKIVALLRLDFGQNRDGNQKPVFSQQNAVPARLKQANSGRFRRRSYQKTGFFGSVQSPITDKGVRLRAVIRDCPYFFSLMI